VRRDTAKKNLNQGQPEFAWIGAPIAVSKTTKCKIQFFHIYLNLERSPRILQQASKHMRTVREVTCMSKTQIYSKVGPVEKNVIQLLVVDRQKISS